MRTNTKSFLNRTTALSATAITAFIASMVIAQADDVTVNSAETAKRTLSDGDNLIIEAGGSVSVVGDSAIVDSANGITVSINNAGSISADTGQSIDLTGSNISTFTNTGTINSTSPGNNPPNYMLVASEITNFINSGSMTSASASGISTTGDMGSFINNEGATINSNQFSAISVSGSLNSFYNAGSIIADESGTYNAIGLQVGLGGISSFTNTATGLIRSNAYGVFTFYDVGTFNNYGDIEGGFYPAVRIGGNVTELTNHADASITSGSITVRISGLVEILSMLEQ